MTTMLDARYGRTPERKRRTRRFAWIGASGFAVAVVAWLIWGGLDGLQTDVEVLDVGYAIVDDGTVSVTSQVTIEPGNAARCAVEAQNEAHAIVGWKVVDVPASDLRTRSITEEVATTELAVTGLINRCWLT